MSIKEQLVAEVAKAVPPTTTLTLTMFGIPLQSWVLILSLVLLLAQLFFLFKNNLGGKKNGSGTE